MQQGTQCLPRPTSVLSKHVQNALAFKWLFTRLVITMNGTKRAAFALSKSVWKSVRSCKSFFYIFATGTRTLMHSLHEQKLFERHTETRRTFQSTAKSRREINFPFPRRRIYICDLKGSSIKSIYILMINVNTTIRNRRLFKCSCHCRKLP